MPIRTGWWRGPTNCTITSSRHSTVMWSPTGGVAEGEPGYEYGAHGVASSDAPLPRVFFLPSRTFDWFDIGGDLVASVLAIGLSALDH